MLMLTHPLDGFSQVRVKDPPALAWIPDDGLLTTLLLLACAATSAAKARTRGTQGRILIDGFGLYKYRRSNDVQVGNQGNILDSRSLRMANM